MKKTIQKLQRRRSQQNCIPSSREGRKEGVKAYNPPVPFPQRLQKEKLEEHFSKFLNMFKKIEINIPFSEALTQMPHYAKFMKDLLSTK